MHQFQLVKRKTVWQFEIFDPQFNTRTLIPPRFTSFDLAVAAYAGVVKKLAEPVRGKPLRHQLLSHAGIMYSISPSIIHASTEIPY